MQYYLFPNIKYSNNVQISPKCLSLKAFGLPVFFSYISSIGMFLKTQPTDPLDPEDSLRTLQSQIIFIVILW